MHKHSWNLAQIYQWKHNLLSMEITTLFLFLLHQNSFSYPLLQDFMTC